MEGITKHILYTVVGLVLTALATVITNDHIQTSINTQQLELASKKFEVVAEIKLEQHGVINNVDWLIKLNEDQSKQMDDLSHQLSDLRTQLWKKEMRTNEVGG